MLDSVQLVSVGPNDQYAVLVMDYEEYAVVVIDVVDGEIAAQELCAAVENEQTRILSEFNEQIQDVGFFDLTSERDEEIGHAIMETAEYFWFADMPHQIEDYRVMYVLAHKPQLKEG